MKVVFMGTPGFAVPTLEKLINSNNDVVAVFTQPDRPNKRGKKITFSPVKQLALKFNIPIYQPERIKEQESVHNIQVINPDVIVVVAYGQIIPESILNIPKFGSINVHASLLPKYRGAAPIQWAIINGEKSTGVTTMFMEKGLDTGDIIYKETIQINDQMNAQELHDILSQIGSEVLMKTLIDIQAGIAPRIKQDHDESTYATMLSKSTGKIFWEKTSEEIHNLIRGTNPWPGAYTIYKNKKLKIFKSIMVEDFVSHKSAGTVLGYNDNFGLLIKTGNGVLGIRELQIPSKKRMLIKEFIKGNNILEGIVLS